MNQDNNSKITLHNKSARLTVDLFGGAITDFHLEEDAVNPLTFAFSKEQMPSNNRAGAPYQGHFLCLGRWGKPSDGERDAGMPDHGQAANMLWQCDPLFNKNTVHIHADSPLEGLKVERVLTLDDENAVYGVEEKVTNTQVLGRLYNMVQHPTLAAPFLDKATVVRCNATEGYNQLACDYSEKETLHWPIGRDENKNLFDLRTPEAPYNSVFSFVVDRQSEYGWISAYSPRYHLLFGYVWKRADYPWIHLWQHWEEDQIKYRGIEFGTAGIHQPFNKIIEIGTKLFGEKTVEYIDAGEMVTRRYLSFLYRTTEDMDDMRDVEVDEERGYIIIKYPSRQIHLKTKLKNFLCASKIKL